MSNRLLQMLAIHAATCAYASNGYRMYDRPQEFKSPPLSKILKPQLVHKFNIKGVEIEARSRKDAIKRYNHLKKK